MIYVGKDYSSTVSGRRLVSVVCEKCQTSYRYELTRQGHGSASSPYFLFADDLEDRAADRAQGNLAKRLDREAELVPCPKCYWINQDLVNRYRRRLCRCTLYLIPAF